MYEVEDLKREYERIIEQEKLLLGSSESYIPLSSEEAYNTTYQILEIASSALVPRGYNSIYNVTDENIAYESVSAHTNLGLALIDRFWMFVYGPDAIKTTDGYSYREVMEAFRRHDLPENIIGDIPDNSSRDDSKKAIAEQDYWQSFSECSPERENESEKRIAELLEAMGKHKTKTGNMLYTADKISAIIITLCYDYHGISPRKSKHGPENSARDLRAMSLCDFCEQDMCKASEMWTTDYLKLRKIIKFDQYGYFTSIMVMLTLIVNQKWYDWREKDYL